jgi:hypothetical protein
MEIRTLQYHTSIVKEIFMSDLLLLLIVLGAWLIIQEWLLPKLVIST